MTAAKGLFLNESTAFRLKLSTRPSVWGSSFTIALLFAHVLQTIFFSQLEESRS